MEHNNPLGVAFPVENGIKLFVWWDMEGVWLDCFMFYVDGWECSSYDSNIVKR